MGLDMYLYGAELKWGEPKQEILTEEIYWRKANAIHNWMVENVQDGVDNCAYYSISESDLKDLATQCRKVLNNPSVERAMEILPTKEGFFFGGTDLNDPYDWEWYLGCLKYTVSKIEKLLAEDKYNYYLYSSSW